MSATASNPEKAWPAWAKGFLAAFEGLGTIRAACEAVKIAPSTAYRLRDRDPSFAAAWEDLEETVTDKLEEEAMRRATEGVERVIYHNGKEVGRERKHSDTLLIFLLKARRPETYRDRLTIDDDREEAERKRLEHASEAELDEALTGVPDNVTPIRRTVE